MGKEEIVVKDCERIFTERMPLLSLWQEISELVYPERADFTVNRNIGTDFGSGLMTSYTVLARRDLGDTIGAMLRPTAKNWFHLRSNFPEMETAEEMTWFEKSTDIIKNAMRQKGSQFDRAVKEADHDYVTFGQAVISVEFDRSRPGMLYRCWHLRDVVWTENVRGEISKIYRKWKPTASQLLELFPTTCDSRVREKATKDPGATIDVIHAIFTRDDHAALFQDKGIIQPFVSLYLDVEHRTIMEEVGSWTSHYVIPRWSTSSGKQYASSPATSTSLPDARMAQQLARVVLVGGEKKVDPPLMVVMGAIHSKIDATPGGTTWISPEYDERLGETIRPLPQDSNAPVYMIELLDRTYAQIKEGFYLNRLNLPPAQGGREMTAYEVGQRVQEYIRQNMPLIEPIEAEYSARLCEATFVLLYKNIPEMIADMPSSLSERSFQFQSESTLHDAVEKIKVGQFMEAQQILAGVVQVEPSTRFIVDFKAATRDTLKAVIPSKWIRSLGDVDALTKKEVQAVQNQQLLAAMQQGASVAKTISEASPTVGQGGYGGVA